MIRSAIVIAKQPAPGRVKTRLCPTYTPAEAAELAAAALRDTIATLDELRESERVLAMDGDGTEWTPRGWRTVGQVTGSLDRRIAHVFAAMPRGPAVLVGMDTPHLTARQLAAFDPTASDACLGRAADGGFWAIGFADPSVAAAAMLGVPMSRADTGRLQHERLTALGLRVQQLDVLEDVDTPASAARVAQLAPATRFAAAVRAIDAARAA